MIRWIEKTFFFLLAASGLVIIVAGAACFIAMAITFWRGLR